VEADAGIEANQDVIRWIIGELGINRPDWASPPSTADLDLAVFLREVGDAADRRTADGGVHAVMVVAM